PRSRSPPRASSTRTTWTWWAWARTPSMSRRSTPPSSTTSPTTTEPLGREPSRRYTRAMSHGWWPGGSRTERDELPTRAIALPSQPLPPVRRAAPVRADEALHIHPLPAAAGEVPAPACARLRALPPGGPLGWSSMSMQDVEALGRGGLLPGGVRG